MLRIKRIAHAILFLLRHIIISCELDNIEALANYLQESTMNNYSVDKNLPLVAGDDTFCQLV
jgi:hypothetical protein